MLINIYLIICCIIIIYLDIKYNKIFNIITYPLIAVACILNYIILGPISLLYSAEGIVAGICACLIPVKLNASGYGEFKLMALVGILKGYYFVILISAMMYLLIIILQIKSLYVNKSFEVLTQKTKVYLDLLLEHGISINTIMDNIYKPTVPFSILVFISVIFGILIT